MDKLSPCNILYISYHTSMKITIHTPSDKQIGNVRVSEHVFNKVGALAKKKNVSNQAIVRAVLEGVIDTVEV